MGTPWKIVAALSAASLIIPAAPFAALAHHPMGGATPQTFWHGVLSGIGHPMLGPDHLAFIVGIGLLVALSRRWLALPAAFVATLSPGVLLHAAGVGLGPVEMLVALSVLLLGLALVNEDRLSAPVMIAAALMAGLLHGYAFGETIVGAEATPIIAYLLGLSVTILALTALIAAIGRAVLSGGLSAPALQRAGALVLIAGGGLFTLLSLVA